MLKTGNKINTLIIGFFLLTFVSVSCKKKKEDDNSLLLLGALMLSQQFHVTERMAIIEGAGTVAANEALALAVANTIVNYAKTIDETATHGFPFQWIVAGQSEDTTAITSTTSNLLVRPPATLTKDGTTYTVKGNVVELCNSGYASAAMGTGKFHAPALPCKVQVWADHTNNKIYVDMTDPRSIFRLFFSDVTDPSTLKDTKGNVVNPQTVYIEIQTVVKTALAAQANIRWETSAIGPAVTAADAKGTEKPYVVEKWLDSGATAVTASDAAKKILDALGTDGINGTATGMTAAKTAAEGWRNARVAGTAGTGTFGTTLTSSYALSFPLGIKIIEPCSPKYAKTAMKYGMWHVGALPCKVAVYEDGGALYVSYLNPKFMFNVLFRDATIDAADVTMVDNVKADIHSIVKQALTGAAVTGGTLKTTPDDVTATVVK